MLIRKPKVSKDIELVKAGGGVLYRIMSGEVYVLLIHRRGFWDLPKGKIEDDESIEQGAVREVAEETGVALPHIVFGLGNTEHHYEQNGTLFHKTTHWYAMITSDESTIPQAEEQIEKTEWVILNEAIKMVEFDNLEIVLQRFKQKKADLMSGQPLRK